MDDVYKLCKEDFYEAVASYRVFMSLDEIYYNLIEDNRGCFKLRSDSAGIFLKFLQSAVLMRMALAVQRLTQRNGGQKDRASLRILYDKYSDQFSDEVKEKIDEAIRNLDNDEFTTKLKECRHGFIAHTLIGESGKRNGFKSKEIIDFIYDTICPLVDLLFDNIGNDDWNGVDDCMDKCGRIADGGDFFIKNL